MDTANETSREIRSSVIASWVLLIVTCLLSFIPYVGFLSWILGSVTVFVAVILGIVVITKGATWHGISILLFSLIVVPVVIFLAPILTSLLATAILEENDSSQYSKPLIESSTESDEAAADGMTIIEDAGLDSIDTAEDKKDP